MRFKKIHIKRSALGLIFTIGLLAIIGFAERKQLDNTCKDVIVKLDNQYENFFMDEHDVLNLMSKSGEEVLLGASFDDINLKAIENRVKASPYIRSAEIFKDLKGNIIVHARLRRPMARIYRPNMPGAYVSIDGAIMPTSTKFSTRVMMITGDYSTRLIKMDEEDEQDTQRLLELIEFIYKDKFWNAQIAQMDIDQQLNIKLYPQVTKQVIEFGMPEGIIEKFDKLRIFYKQILPQKGWNSYERVNLEFKDQIVAE